MPTSEMIRDSDNIQFQIDILDKRLESEPEKFTTGKWNPKHFSLKGKIAKLKKEKIGALQYEFLAK